MTAFLPQHDKRTKKRAKDLNSRQQDYHYNYDYVSPLALCDDVPFRDEFSVKWLMSLGTRLMTVLRNLLDVEKVPHIRDSHEKKHRFFKGLVEAATFDIEGMLETLQAAIEMSGEITRPNSYEEYATLFQAIGIPPIHRDYRMDEVFADLRVSGPNPMMLHRIDKPDDRFPVTEEHFQDAMAGDSLEAAGKEGRLFLCDYQMLEQLEKSDFPIEKFIYVPLALFATNKATGKLTPVAIQCGQIPGPDNPIITPNCGVNWLIAKTVVGMADGNVHEPVTHLARTHLFVEPFVLATQRQLATNHPLGVLLRPHFEGTLHINDLAAKYLIADRGGVDRLCAGTIGSIRKMAVKGVQDHSFNEVMLPDQLRSRGLDNTETLPNYPFRDDAVLYWDAIQTWVTDYLAVYYKSDADVQEDTELQAWFQELIAQDGARVIGFGENGSMGTLAYLIKAATLIIYTSSCQHAAVNFPQYDLMSYVGSMPLALYGEIPKSATGATEQEFLDILPPLEQANLQMCLGYGLGSMHYTQLGEYGHGHFRDHQVKDPLHKFQNRIKEIGETIEQRNSHRRPYKFLLPEGIPQSINI